ncbi:MAG: winged helix-turn-helix transcriptional regulator [Deltaproteobacteria bacterium]|nr:winged helix-turn-helix transcriptional regulator [Deltaproteobacteria bacterium]
MADLSNRDLAILNDISRQPTISQRELARKSGISLGLINVTIKKFVEDGYINTARVNKRKIKYLLTPEGVEITTKRSYQKLNTTIRNYKEIEKELVKLLLDLYQAGFNYFSIHGNGDLREFVETTFKNCLVEAPVTLGTEHSVQPRAVVLKISADPIDQGFKGGVINVLERLGSEV